MIEGEASSSEVRPILGLGTVVVDHQAFLKALPEPDTKGEILSDRFQVGGPVPTALALLSRFGVETSFIGKWSTDKWGSMIEEDLGRSKVSIGNALVHPQFRTGFAHVWVEKGTGRRSIAAYRGSHEIVEADLDGVDWSRYGALHLDGWSTDAAIVAAERMKVIGGKVFLDLGSPKGRLEDLIGCIDHVNCPKRLLDTLYPGLALELGASRLLDNGAASVSVTDGAQGSWLVTRERTIHQPAFEIEVVDTNGAGDVFSGAMVYGLVQGWEHEDCLLFAAAAAALKCQETGNRSALPTRGQIESFLDGAEIGTAV
jgi:sugar/nucleoside kinase (ribokinase family)